MINTETHRNAGNGIHPLSRTHTPFVCASVEYSSCSAKHLLHYEFSYLYACNNAYSCRVILLSTSIRHLIDFNFLLFANLSLFALDIKLTITSAGSQSSHHVCTLHTHTHTHACVAITSRAQIFKARIRRNRDERAARNASLSFAKVEIGIVDWFYFWMWKLCKQLDMSVVIVVAVVVVGAAASA